MMHVEIMYADKEPDGKYRRVRVPLYLVDDLDKTGVLFIILSRPSTEQMARRTIDGRYYRRADEIYGLDRFVVVTYTDGTASLWGWDDHSFKWTPEGDSTDRTVERPYFFEGPCLTVADWKIAVEQFGNMH